MIDNLANKRAAFAYKEISKLNEQMLQNYRSLVRSFSAMILNNGYGLAIAFLYSKKDGNNQHKFLYQHIEEWLKKQNFLKDQSKDLMTNITESDNDYYRFLEAETLSLLEWLKRFTEGICTGKGAAKLENQ